MASLLGDDLRPRVLGLVSLSPQTMGMAAGCRRGFPGPSVRCVFHCRSRRAWAKRLRRSRPLAIGLGTSADRRAALVASVGRGDAAAALDPPLAAIARPRCLRCGMGIT